MLHPSAVAITAGLRKAIIDGACPAGTELHQDALAGEHGVDPAVIRSALLQLDAEGLVRITPGVGAVVSSISREEIDDVFDLRGDPGTAAATRGSSCTDAGRLRPDRGRSIICSSAPLPPVTWPAGAP